MQNETINGFTVEQVGAKMYGTSPTLEDFRPAGFLKATATGYSSCKSADFARAVLQIHREFEQEESDGERIYGIIATYAALRLCANENHEVETAEGDLDEFLNLNGQLVARLCAPAFVINFPGAAKEIMEHSR
jgi:hypothetical protein